MNNNLELEKELNNVENVEMNNIQDVEIQNDIKDINSKVDELNVLINQKNSKSENSNVDLKKENNLIQNNNQVFEKKEKTIVDLKKEIFDHRKLIRWTSFFSFFSILSLGLFLFWFIGAPYINPLWKLILPTTYNDSNVNYFFVFNVLFVVLLSFSTLTSYILNIIVFTKLWHLRKIYLPFFILSFFIPILTWLYCMGIIAFMKYNNKINYFGWLKEKNVHKYDKKIKNYANLK